MLPLLFGQLFGQFNQIYTIYTSIHRYYPYRQVGYLLEDTEAEVVDQKTPRPKTPSHAK